jgi:hypothetical protein
MPLLNIGAVTGNRKTIQTALCFLSREKDIDYKWAIVQYQGILQDEGIPNPLLFVTDRELALMNTLDFLFPNTNHVLCTWHVNMNILANCRKHFPADLKDPTMVAKDNPHGYVTNPKWTDFLKDWADLLDSATNAEYTSRLVKFRTYPKVPVVYIESTWLIWKEKLVKCWVDICLHFGVRVTSPIEGCHAVLKAYLQVSTGDLKGVFDRLFLYWPTQHRAISDTRAIEQGKMMYRLNKRYFDLVQYLVYNKALLLIIHKCVKLHKFEEEANIQWPCKCIIQSSIGLPCYHDLFKRFRDGGQVLPTDIHPFWWYNQDEGGISVESDIAIPQAVLEPAIVQGKGRPRGSRGKGRNQGTRGIVNRYLIPSITVLISCS